MICNDMIWFTSYKSNTSHKWDGHLETVPEAPELSPVTCFSLWFPIETKICIFFNHQNAPLLPVLKRKLLLLRSVCTVWNLTPFRQEYPHPVTWHVTQLKSLVVGKPLNRTLSPWFNTDIFYSSHYNQSKIRASLNGFFDMILSKW